MQQINVRALTLPGFQFCSHFLLILFLKFPSFSPSGVGRAQEGMLQGVRELIIIARRTHRRELCEELKTVEYLFKALLHAVVLLKGNYMPMEERRDNIDGQLLESRNKEAIGTRT